MIPAEAVEAAAKAAFASAWRGCAWDGRDGTTEETRERFRREARAALEAAAPYLLKQGWDEGYKAGLFDKEYYSHNRNPYMLNNEGEK